MMKRTRKSTKGKRITADYIPYDVAYLKGKELLWGDKPVIGFYIILSINTGLRASDLLARKHSEFIKLKAGDSLDLQESKTKKLRQIQVNSKVIEAYKELQRYLMEQGKYNADDYVFKSKKGTVYAIPSLNTILKEVFAGHAKNISTHSLRKSFGRHVYETNGESERALMLLSEIFQHSSMSITRKYLGLRQEEIGDVYMNL